MGYGEGSGRRGSSNESEGESGAGEVRSRRGRGLKTPLLILVRHGEEQVGGIRRCRIGLDRISLVAHCRRVRRLWLNRDATIE
jgi:hypothetical protein